MEKKKKAVSAPEKIETTYDGFIQQYWEESRWRETCPHVIKVKGLPWEDTRQGGSSILFIPKYLPDCLPLGVFCRRYLLGGGRVKIVSWRKRLFLLSTVRVTAY